MALDAAVFTIHVKNVLSLAEIEILELVGVKVWEISIPSYRYIINSGRISCDFRYGKWIEEKYYR